MKLKVSGKDIGIIASDSTTDSTNRTAAVIASLMIQVNGYRGF